MSTTEPVASHFSTRMISELLAYLEHHLPADEVVALLKEAGEDRPVAEVRRDATWTSRDWYTGLVVTASEHLGGPLELEKVAPWAATHTMPPEFVAAIRSTGNPQSMITGLAHAIGSFDPALVMEVEEATATSWTVDLRRRPGVPMLRGTCALYRGVISTGPTFFGGHPAEVVETACQCDGAPSCRFSVTFSPTSEEERHLSLLELDGRLLRSRLEHLQQIVEEIGSGSDTVETLHRILGTAMAATAATGGLLVARDRQQFMTVAEGLSEESAGQLGAALLADEAVADSNILVEEVSSARRRHGLIALLGVGQELHVFARQILATYANLAAGVLDVQVAVDDAQHEAQTATSLLDLAIWLSDLDSPHHLTHRLARALPNLVGFERAAVFLEADGQPPLLAATHGYDPTATVPTLPRDLSEIANPRFLDPEEAPSDGAIRSVVAPLGNGTRRVGWLLVEAEGTRVARRSDAEVLALTAGAAAQAAIALANGRLLDEVSHQALHDPLTGLGNRALVHDRAQAALSQRRAMGQVAVLFLDLDGFKAVNDTVGHAAGDQVLRAVADRLRAVTREEDLVGRMGGDEFVVLIADMTSDSDPGTLGERVLAVLAEPYPLVGPPAGSVTLSASIGIATSSSGGADDLLQEADIALYRAKEAGKNCIVVFEPAMHATRLARHQLEVELGSALDSDQLFLLWQPVIDLETGRIKSAEALLRWQHPVHGTIEPVVLIPILEETGMILAVGRWILTTACAQARAWHAAGLMVSVSVNISARQLADEHFVADVVDTVAASDLHPADLVLEISETTLMLDLASASTRLHALKAAGVGIAVDNFGTGYSSLGQLSALPIDAIKIDRSLISAIAGETGVRALVHTLVAMGRALGVETLAEGVEAPEQDNQVRAEAFDSAQGFLFAPPLSVSDIAQLLRSQSIDLARQGGLVVDRRV